MSETFCPLVAAFLSQVAVLTWLGVEFMVVDVQVVGGIIQIALAIKEQGR